MIHFEELLTTDLAGASAIVCEQVVPDVSAALDRVMPQLADGDRMAVRRYCLYIDTAARALTTLPAHRPDELPSASVLYSLLVRATVELPWVAPSLDGVGILTVLVDRLRGCAAGLPSTWVHASRDIDEHYFAWFVKLASEVELEREHTSPLRRAMSILDLSSADVAEVMGVQRQAVDKWLLAGLPVDRVAKIGALSEVASILHYRLRDGLPPVVVRRGADAYGGRSMLEVIKDDEHEWLLQSVKQSFDFASVA